MKTRQLAGRFAVASLLTFLAPIVLCLPQTYAETYVGGQLGLTFPGNGLSSGDLTSTSAPFSGTPSGTVNFPSGTTIDDQSLKTRLSLERRMVTYFARLNGLA